jgi:3-dehydroquinate dehydratase-1
MHTPKFYRWPADLQGDFSRPCIVGTLSTLRGFDSLQATTPDACDVIELRQDLLGLPAANSLKAAQAFLEKGVGVIFTCRLKQEGGTWEEDSTERFDLLAEALTLGTIVDIEAASAFSDQLLHMADTLNRCVILSTHDFEATPSLGLLRDRCRMQDARPCIIHKAATQLQSEADIAVLRKLITESPDLAVCAMGMGTLGPQSRIDLAKAGSCLTYGYLDQPAAPGQLSCSEILSAFQSSDG